jgi:hypothetical protein
VTHNATLTGNGTVGSPLGINLANSNTWTANQTFAGTFLITANSRIAMTNSDNNARDIRLQEPSGSGSQYFGIRCPPVTNNGNYLWPAAVGSVGQVMSISYSNGIDSAYMTWSTPSAGAVTIDSTLIGNGTGGSPLGLDLNQINVWTSTITTFTGFLESRNEPFVITNTDNIANEMRIQEASGNGSNFVALRADTSITTNDIFILPSNAASAGDVLTAVAINTPSNRFTTMAWSTAPKGVYGGTTAGNSNGARFSSPNGQGESGTENTMYVVCTRAGTIRNLNTYCTAAPAGAASKTITVRINGANSLLAATITGAATTASNTANSVSVAVGDLLSISVTHAGGPANSSVSWGFELY